MCLTIWIKTTEFRSTEVSKIEYHAEATFRRKIKTLVAFYLSTKLLCAILALMLLIVIRMIVYFNRDYKEHGGKKRDDPSLRKEDSTASTPSLNSWGPSRSDDHRRSWSSSTNLAQEKERHSNATTEKGTEYNSPASWTSTPDLANLEDNTQANIPTVRISLPKRKSIPVDKQHRTGK